MPTQTKTKAKVPSARVAQPAPRTNLPAVRKPSQRFTREDAQQIMNNPAPPVAATIEQRSAPALSRYSVKLVKAILDISKEIGPVEKAGNNTFHNYHYQKWEDVLNKMSPLCAKYGLVITQSETARSIVDKLVAITYKFTIVNTDGDVWPDELVWTAIARLEDQKGIMDDKAANKAHVQAQKYFMLSTFKIRVAGADLDDSDNYGNDVKPGAPRAKPPVPSPDGRMKPHTLSLEGEKLATWAPKFIAAISKATSIEDVDKYIELNDFALTEISNKNPKLYSSIDTAIKWRKEQLGQATKPAPERPADMPDYKTDCDGFLKWINTQCAAHKDPNTFEAFWDNEIEPHLSDLMPPDKDECVGIFRKHEKRLEP